jgi:hypothetical protein
VIKRIIQLTILLNLILLITVQIMACNYFKSCNKLTSIKIERIKKIKEIRDLTYYLPELELEN